MSKFRRGFLSGITFILMTEIAFTGMAYFSYLIFEKLLS